MIWSILIILIIVILFSASSKIEHIKLRNSSKKISAEVVEYRKEKGLMRNDYTLLNYPYVKIELDDGDYTIRKLRYANSSNKPFKIGEKIFVFWYVSHLLYWNAYDRGLYKYLPESWNLKK
jgi:hypothetical protein